jgi:hypothetical protein
MKKRLDATVSQSFDGKGIVALQPPFDVAVIVAHLL